ncbi:MAG: type II toxin-antitoxin system HipA family toxin [Pseudomonadota bacterium]
MTGETLIAIASGREMGVLTCGKNLDLSFEYADNWRRMRGAYPLSLSMPLAARKHGSDKVTPFLWGLLPDNAAVLDQWGKSFHVSPRNPFALLSHVGEDCAGAIQFVRPERVEALASQQNLQIEWLSEKDVEDRLRTLSQNHAAGRRAEDLGQFSLAGAQPKTALIFTRGKWGVPSGATPTTHILKPPTGAFDGIAENEHFCLRLANAVGLPTARSEVKRFGDEFAFVSHRYDRREIEGRIVRIHQEDFCQALSVMPQGKYQNEGGPGTDQIIEGLQTWSSNPQADIETFVKANIFNCLIAGTDAHAKNYALLISGSSVRLAPLYDIISTLPYADIPIQKAKLAMKIGGEYRLQKIGVRQWEEFGKVAKISTSDIEKMIRDMSGIIGEASAETRIRIHDEGVGHPILDTLSEHIAIRADKCAKAFK